MKNPIIMFSALAASGALFASELTVELNEKVISSDVVAVVKLKSVTEMDIVEVRGFNRMRIRLVFSVSEVLKGEATDEITVLAESVSFSHEGSSYSASAGFSGSHLKSNDEFIAYLRKEDKEDPVYGLTGDSNQFLEEIDRRQGTVTDVGQTSRQVNLATKLRKIQRILDEILGEHERSD